MKSMSRSRSEGCGRPIVWATLADLGWDMSITFYSYWRSRWSAVSLNLNQPKNKRKRRIVATLSCEQEPALHVSWSTRGDKTNGRVCHLIATNGKDARLRDILALSRDHARVSRSAYHRWLTILKMVHRNVKRGWDAHLIFCTSEDKCLSDPAFDSLNFNAIIMTSSYHDYSVHVVVPDKCLRKRLKTTLSSRYPYWLSAHKIRMKE